MKEKILFKTYSGSKLYGTNNENSDTDFKGVFLPELKDLILGKAPKHYVLSTGKANEKNNNTDVDETYYSLQYFLELASKGDTNAIDMLFAYTNKEAVIIKDPIWDELIKNTDQIITKNIKAYIGFCKGQAIKYSIKGEKLNNFNTFFNICKEHYNDKNETGTPKTLVSVLLNVIGDFNIPKVGEERIKLNNIFGDHCYLITADNKESFISISDVKFQLYDTVKTAYHKCKKVIESYGKRAETAANADGADMKALSHCIRVLFEVEELLTTGKITFPLKEAEFIKSIKFNTTALTFKEIMEWIEKKIKYIDTLIPTCNLPEHSNINWINSFILNSYEHQ